MKLNVRSLPLFAGEAARLTASRSGEKFGDLTIGETEKLIKTFVYEAIKELQEPDEKSLLYYTRIEASKMLDVSPPTIDAWVREGLLKFRWMGNRKIFLQEDLAALVSDTNYYNQKENGKD